MKTPFISITALIICVLSFCISPVEAKLVPIAITAEVTSVLEKLGSLEGRINVGDLITGVYVYDSSTPDSHSMDIYGDYEHYTPPAGFTLTVGGFVFMTDPDNVEFIISITNDQRSIGRPYDSFGIESINNLPLPNGLPVNSIKLALYDSNWGALSSDELPTTAPVLDDWETAVVRVAGGGDPRGGGKRFEVTGRLTSAVLIPEPATLALLAFGGLALLKKRRERIKP